MTHPKDRGLSRGQLLKGVAGLALGAGAAGAASGCANTTTAIGACEGGGTGGAASTSALVESKPAGPLGLPLPRPDNSVTWKILADNQPVAEATQTEGGTLRLYNYADYLWPGLIKKFEKRYGCQVKLATYNSSDEALAKLSSGQVVFDVVLGLSADAIVRLIAQKLMQPLNHAKLPNLEHVWPQLQDPFYDRGSRYSVPYVVWLDGIGWRNDKIRDDIAGMKVPWDIFWESGKWKGKVGLLDDTRDGLSMPMQRDAMRTGARPDLNTEDAAVIAKAGNDLAQLTRICDIKVAITDYQTLPEAKTWLHHSWSGDIVGAALYYMPKGVKPDVLSFWGPQQNGVFQNDLMFITRASKKPALAHAFLNFLMDERNAYDNMVQFVGYTPPQNAIDASTLVKRGLIPESLAGAVLSPDQFSNNQELLSLSPDGLKRWENAWSRFKAG
jgi:spermidine/putrescine transport system substrate-binding protein